MIPATHSPAREFTSPIHAVGIEASIRTQPIGIRAPYLSQTAPKTNLMQMSKATAQMLVVQISLVLRLRSSLIWGRRGAMANQMKKAMKKDHHAKWNALRESELVRLSKNHAATSRCCGNVPHVRTSKPA